MVMLPPRSLMLLQMVPMLVLFVGSVIRLPDVAFDVTLATHLDSADGAAMLLFAAAVMVFMVQMWHHSAGRLLTASMLSVLSFAAVKGYADSLDVPHLICKSRAPQIRPGPVPCMTLVTGANSGIGKATAQLLAQQGHVVIMACRSNASCAVAAEEIKQSTDKGTIIPMGGLDLASLEATRAWAAQVTGKVDYLFNNAGVIPTGAVTTGDGLELGLGVSYVGHLALSRWLLAAGVLTPATVSVQTASDAARLGSLHASLFDDAAGGEGDLRGELTTGCAIPLPFCVPPKRADMHLGGRLNFGAYPRAKLANVLYARELHRRHGLPAVSVHPGMVDTPMAANVGHLDALGALVGVGAGVVLRAPEVAAAVLVRCAAAAKRSPGAFCNGRGEPMPDALVPAKFVDVRSSERLWEVAEAAVRRFEAGETV